MTYLLDTHTLLWIVADDPKLSEAAKSIYLNRQNDIYLSAASVWEMAIKVSIGKLHLDYTLQEFVKRHVYGNSIKVLDLHLDYFYQVENLPYHHRDPFDRLIIVQGMTENIPILSTDTVFDSYPVHRIW